MIHLPELLLQENAQGIRCYNRYIGAVLRPYEALFTCIYTIVFPHSPLATDIRIRIQRIRLGLNQIITRACPHHLSE